MYGALLFIPRHRRGWAKTSKMLAAGRTVVAAGGLISPSVAPGVSAPLRPPLRVSLSASFLRGGRHSDSGLSSAWIEAAALRLILHLAFAFLG